MEQDKADRAFRLWRELDDKEIEACKDIDAQIIVLQEQRRRAVAPFVEKKNKLEALIIEHVKENVGQEYATAYAVATWRNGYSRRSWDMDGLDGLKSNKVVWKAISKFRKETSIEPTVKIVRPK